jgi:predicted ATPase
VLVSGYAGIGKSSVVNELQKALVPPRGLFASGKFDQYKRDIPYATLAQAFRSLVRPLLGESEAGRCQSNGGSSTCSAIAISRAAIYATRARHSAKAAERLCL